MPGLLNPSNPASFCNIGKIALYFPSKYCYGLPSATIPAGYLSTQTISASSGSLTETIKTNCLSYWNPATPATPTNQTTLDQLTQTFTTDYSNWRKVYYDFVFAGICNLAPSALNDVVEFKYLSENKACYTRAYSYPFNWSVQNLGHFDVTNDCMNSIDTGTLNWDQQPYRSYYGPPGQCSGSQLQLTRYGLIFADGRLQSKFLSTDNL